MNNAKTYPIRAAQLDLARQMETVTFIKEFIDFIADNGYNTLLLYLEARVRTASFPYPTADESYSSEQMRDVVAHAKQRGVEVIPCVSCLGHAEQFLQYPALRDLAEIQDGSTGRFGGDAKLTFCPANVRTRTFITQYLRELCEIFPSQYLHLGFDEVFDFACCPACKTQNFDQEQQQFLEYLLFCHALVTTDLGRRMMMWDDMFEFYPDILVRTPRDIIMVYWQYQQDVQQGEGHFLNLIKSDVLSLYDQLGFEYLIAPGDLSASNIRTFTDYADQHHPLGGLLTMWEKSTSFLYRTYPTIAYAGHLWSSGERDHARVFSQAITRLFGSEDTKLKHVFSVIADAGLFFDGGYNMQQPWSLQNRGLNYAAASQHRLISACLQNIATQIHTDLGRRVVDDISLVYQFAELRFHLEQESAAFWTGQRSTSKKQVRDVIKQLQQLQTQRAKQWATWRSDLQPNHYNKLYESTLHSLQAWLNQKEPEAVMMVRFCLPDKYSGQHCRISLQYDSKWVQQACGIFKGQVPGDAIYSYYFPVHTSEQPTAIRLEAWGAGGIGLAYFQVRTQSGRYRPNQIPEIQGSVSDAPYVLDNDVKAAWLGERNTRVTFHDRSAYHRVHQLTCDLVQETPFA